jgi:hypothetical protein
MNGIPVPQLYLTAIAAGSIATGAGTTANRRGRAVFILAKAGKSGQNPLSLVITMGA